MTVNFTIAGRTFEAGSFSKVNGTAYWTLSIDGSVTYTNRKNETTANVTLKFLNARIEEGFIHAGQLVNGVFVSVKNGSTAVNAPFKATPNVVTVEDIDAVELDSTEAEYIDAVDSYDAVEIDA